MAGENVANKRTLGKSGRKIKEITSMALTRGSR
jgi:hypothetical protein